jgi:NTP pyrophosphatase (non-canonical NTP hydrolase)
MSPNEYQKLANRTLIDKPDFQITPEQVMIAWNSLGLSGEAGEVNDHIKKGIFHQQGIDKNKLKKELGDCLWYIAALCTEFEFTLEECMLHNIEKLKARFPDGYSPDRTTFKEGIAS